MTTESPKCASCPAADRCLLRTTRPADRVDFPEQGLQSISLRKRDENELTALLQNHVLFSRQGAFKITTDSGDIYQVVAQGEYFGFELHLSRENLNVGLRAKALVPDIEVCSLDFHAYQKLLLERPAMTMAVMTNLATHTLTARIAYHWSKKSLRERAILTLYYLRSRFGIRYGQFKMIDVPLTKIDIASLMCTVQESAVRVLSELREEGLISPNGKRIIILDNARLDSMYQDILDREREGSESRPSAASPQSAASSSGSSARDER